MQEKELWSRAFMSREEFERMRETPLSDAIVNPIPEPVDVATAEELAPLYSFLSASAPLQPNALGDMTFDRGTVTSDKRLDLCKQVIGPAGIIGLFDALAKDRQSQRHVQHLLLGNNICGPELPLKVAEYISTGGSQLTTWYIAGNRLTGESLRPLCDVLERDCQVRQLWLKRNPLKLGGAQRVAKMLKVNSYMQVLDLSFCGIMDAGAEVLMEALRDNQALRHIYLDANGLSKTSADQLANLLAEGGALLETLSVGLNRLHDEGAEALAGALTKNTSLKKFCIASCGIGSSGIESVAAALKNNCHLVELDIGFLKATAATGEVPNRAEDAGGSAVAAALKGNTTLRALKLSHNCIGVDGRRALRDALCGAHPNKSLVVLEYEQRGMPRDPPVLRDEVTAALLRNLGELPDGERSKMLVELRPHHLSEIASVYRLGNMYSPGPPSDDTSL
jgi:Ran GTPase-activating protein (RanGAP) involved in mRNA processing and transport